ncbi:gamma-glutamyltransferase [Bacteriovorax sp. Seq25_V]|uniref:gamma-glutamyltransferase n=1 Tax=Bacteriovorax sp. Seq25_V TaxID=1201288 RepID=UPI00038A3584|nr:gamma-glutamyltransferase [Bacteriovorax sp. Seq25_V]EQC47434.1 gamma-glutamyltransferase [Bacteriovorax sp. Seq25_V]
MKNYFYVLLLLNFVACSTNNKPILLETVSEFKKENHLATSKKAMIATQGKYSTSAGERIYKLGGNIIDVMTAVSFVISVERPQSTGIGGGGFLMYHHAKTGKTFAFDFRERAPFLSDSRMFVDEKGNVIKNKSVNGIFSVGTPGLVAGILDIHKKYGKLPLKEVLADSIKLAKEGMIVYPELEKALVQRRNVLCLYESSKKIFCPNGNLLKTGDLLVQSDLAKTITLIAKKGKKEFYRGSIAKKIVATSKKYKGLLTDVDFAKYEVKTREPVAGTYKGKTILSMSPPSSGGIHIIEILNILERYDLKSLGIYDPKAIHLVSSAMELAFADRAKYLGDSDFVQVPIRGLTNKDYSDKLASKINENKAFSFDEVKAGDAPKFEPDHTTHFSIMDNEGNVVVSTQTINGYFGSGLVAEGTGIVLNNEMDDFANKVGAQNIFGAVGGEKNLVEPGKRPLSSMSPTIVFDGKKPLMAVGTPSGTRILTCVMQTILNYFEYELPIYDAVATARYHHQWRPHYIRFDEGALTSTNREALEKMGHQVEEKNLGCRIQAVVNEDGELIGVSDPRGEGKAQGL